VLSGLEAGRRHATAGITAEGLQAFVDAVQRLEHGTQALTTALGAMVPRYLFEHGFDPAGGSLTVNPASMNVALVEHIIIEVPTGTTAVLQLGPSFKLSNLQPGITDLRAQLPLLQNDARTLTVTGTVSAGGSGLFLFGKILPTPHPTTP
jgi:hypothetical protein